MIDLAGKTALVTGGSRGIGRACCEMLARAGARVAVNYRVEQPSADGIRATDPAFQRAIDERLLNELQQRQLAVEFLDPDRRDLWLDNAERLVQEHLAPPQLQLL